MPAPHLYVHVPFCAHRCGYCDFVTVTGHDARHAAYVDAAPGRARAGARGAGRRARDDLPRRRHADAARGRRCWGACWTGCRPPARSPSRPTPRRSTRRWPGARRARRARLAGRAVLRRGASSRRSSAAPRPRRCAPPCARLRAAGVENLSLDLLFGIPGERERELDRDLDAALALEPQHLSCYELEAKPGTRFTHRHGAELKRQAELMEGHYEHVIARLEAAGYRWYETANFCRDEPPLRPQPGLLDGPRLPRHRHRRGLDARPPAPHEPPAARAVPGRARGRPGPAARGGAADRARARLRAAHARPAARRAARRLAALREAIDEPEAERMVRAGMLVRDGGTLSPDATGPHALQRRGLLADRTVTDETRPLSSRQELILCEVVSAYIAGGQPVGSKTLVESGAVTASSSTVRYELAELEGRGMLDHPHTSAGRVPTEGGYRYYAGLLLRSPLEPAPLPLDIAEQPSRARPGAARHRRGAGAGHEPAGGRLGALARDRAGAPRRAAAPAAAGRDGRRDHVDGRHRQAPLRRSTGPSTAGSWTGRAPTWPR